MYQNIVDNFIQIGSYLGVDVTASANWYYPLILPERLSLKSAFLGVIDDAGLNTKTTISFGVYSYTGSTLSLLASASASSSKSASTFYPGAFYLSFTNWDSTLDLSPGNYWVGFVASVTFTVVSNPVYRLQAQGGIFCAPPTGLVLGSHTSTQTSLYSTLHTSKIRQGRALFQNPFLQTPHIILSS